MQETAKQTACAVLHGWAKRQLKQPSTWRGLALIATAAGVHFDPAMVQSVISVGAAVAGAIDVFKNDEK